MLVTSGQLKVPNGVTAVTFAKIDEVAMSETFLLKLSLARAHTSLYTSSNIANVALLKDSTLSQFPGE